MFRRRFLQTSTALGFSGLGSAAWAHHGWSSFDQNRPIYLEGRAVEVKWRNPHAELVLELPEKATLPADLAQTLADHGVAFAEAGTEPAGDQSVTTLLLSELP